MRTARPGKERHVVRLMNKGDRDGAVAYMKKNGMIQAFEGAPEWKAVSVPEPGPRIPVVSSPDEYKYPEFKPVRDPVPEGVKWARIKRELGHALQKVVVFEEDDHLPEHKKRQALLWMTFKEQDQARKKGRIVGQAFPIHPNPNDVQGGWCIWRK